MKTIRQKIKQTVLLVGTVAMGISGIVSMSHAQGWTFKQEMPAARGFLSGTVLGERIYVIGGVDNIPLNGIAIVEMYNPILNAWVAMENLPEPRCAHATCTYKGKIYVFGGAYPNLKSRPINTVFEYDPQTNTWTKKADMPYAITSCAAAAVNDTIYLIGGGGVYWPPISTVMAYHPSTEAWLEKPPISMARGVLSACVVDGKIYAIGGTTQNYNVDAYRLVEVFDPATNTWTQMSDMPTGRWGLSTCVVDGKIFAVGGWRNGSVLTTTEMYDPTSDSWQIKPNLQERRFGFCLGTVDHKLYAIGGAHPDINPTIPYFLSSVEELDLDITDMEDDFDKTFKPMNYELHQNYPNPFNPATKISYFIANVDRVILKIYDVLGKEVACLVDQYQHPGRYEVVFNATNLTSGIYLYTLKVGREVTETKKMILIR